MSLYVVIGPPAAGKSTWCAKQAQRGDIIVDYDKLAHALTIPTEGKSAHSHEASVKKVAKAARQAAIDAAIRVSSEVDVYVIHSSPSDALLTSYRNRGAEVVTIDPGYDIVMARAKVERPWQMQGAIKAWYQGRGATHAPRSTPKTTTEKGLGWDHQQVAKELKRVHVEGTICWWCGEPMYLSQGLAADHSKARAKGGTKADRLLHGPCNSARGKGERDHLRPALKGKVLGNRMAW